jgi:hypothetical protein
VTGSVSKSINWEKTPDVPNFSIVAWEDVKKMSSYGMEIEAHSVSHKCLPTIPIYHARKEIEESKVEIERVLKKKVNFFSYPYGEFNDDIKRTLKETGFKGAVSLSFGKVTLGADVYSLKRINVGGISRVGNTIRMRFFKSCLFGTGNWYMALKSYLPFLVRSGLPPEIFNKN